MIVFHIYISYKKSDSISYIYMYIHTHTQWSAEKFIGWLSWNVTKWCLFFNIVPFAVHTLLPSVLQYLDPIDQKNYEQQIQHPHMNFSTHFQIYIKTKMNLQSPYLTDTTSIMYFFKRYNCIMRLSTEGMCVCVCVCMCVLFVLSIQICWSMCVCFYLSWLNKSPGNWIFSSFFFNNADYLWSIPKVI